MKLITLLTTAFLAYFSFAALGEAKRKEYAKRKGLDAKSSRAMVSYLAHASKKLLAGAIIFTAIYGRLVYFNADSFRLFGKWLLKAGEYSDVLADFLALSLMVVGIPVITALTAYAIVWLLDGSSTFTELMLAIAKKCFRACCWTGAFCVLAMVTSDSASNSFAKLEALISSLTLLGVVEYVSVCAYIASLVAFGYIVALGVRYAEELVEMLRNRRKANHYQPKH